MHSSAGGSRTHRRQFLRLAALPVCVPRQSVRRAGVEPAWPARETGDLTRSQTSHNVGNFPFAACGLAVRRRKAASRKRRVPGGSRTRLSGLEDRRLGRSATGTYSAEGEGVEPSRVISLVPFRAGCHRLLACPSVSSSLALPSTGRVCECDRHFFESGRLDLNQRSRASEARDHSRLVHVPSSAIRSDNEKGQVSRDTWPERASLQESVSQPQRTNAQG